MSLLSVSCLGGRRLETLSPTPTPPLGGSIFFEPSRVSAETKTVEVWLVNVSGQIPSVESAVVITEPTAVQEIITTLLTAVSGAPSKDLPTVEPGGRYVLDLHLFNREDIAPLSGTSAEWLVASVTYKYDVGIIAVHRPDARGGRKTERYPVGVELLEILQRELALQGVALPD